MGGDQQGCLANGADAMAFYQAGVISAKLGDTRHAQKLMQKALELNPFFGRPQADAAKVFLGKG